MTHHENDGEDRSLSFRKMVLPVFLSATMAAVFTERTVYDLLVWTSVSTIPRALLDVAVIFIFLFALGITLFALVIRKEQVKRWEAVIEQTVKEIREEVFPSPRIVIITLAILFLVVTVSGITEGVSFLMVIREWVQGIWDQFKGVLWSLLILASAGLVYLLIRSIRRAVQIPAESVETSLKEWFVGTNFVYVLWLVYLLVYYFRLWPTVPHDAKMYFIRVLLEDSAVYAFLTMYLINGMYRYGQVVKAQNPRHRWLTFTIFAVFAAFVAVMALFLDIRSVTVANNLAAQVLSDEQFRIHRFHVYFRDWVLVVPLTLVVFGWLIKQIAESFTEE